MAAEREEGHRPPPPEAYSWLVYSDGKDQIFCSISNTKETYVRTIPELQNKTCLASTTGHGWCLYSYSSATPDWCLLCLWNPVTLEEITLPPLNLKAQFIKNFILSSSPTEPDCMVILFVSEPPLIIYCGSIIDGEWIKLSYLEELNQSLHKAGENKLQNYSNERILGAVCCNGNLYGVTSPNKMIVQIHIIQPNSLKISPIVNAPFTHVPQYSDLLSTIVMESCGELFCFIIMLTDSSSRYITAIVIYKLDFDKLVWLKVESAKDRAFFLPFNFDNQSYNGFSCPASTEIEGNCVYFTLADGHKKLYSYNIEEGKLSISSPFPNLPTRKSSPIWVMPADLRLSSTILKEAKHRINMEEQGSGKVQEKVNDLEDVEVANETKAHLPCLPLDMLKLIAKRLILVDYLHFRATCKMFHSVAPQIQWRIATPRLENPSLSPWLVLFGKESVYSFIDPNHGDKYLINLPQVLKEGSIIRGSKDGWLLVTVRMSTFFFNPFTQALLPLADRRAYIRNPCMGFSSTPDSSECVAVEIGDKTNNNSNFFVNLCSLGKEDWDLWEFEYTNFSFDCNSPVFYKGAFYYLGKEGNLGILKLNDEEHSFEVLTKPKPPCNDNFQKFLVECNGELLSIFVAPFEKGVRVFKLNESIMTWVRVENLGNYMLYVSHKSSMSAIAKSPGMENKIYFPRFYGESIVFYSLETDNYHSFKSKDVVDFYSTTEVLCCGWIEPRWC